jgi:hypothetical protein
LIYDKSQKHDQDRIDGEVSESGQEFCTGEEACPVFGHVRFPFREWRTLIGFGGQLTLFAIIAIFAIRTPLPVPAVLCLLL